MLCRLQKTVVFQNSSDSAESAKVKIIQRRHGNMFYDLRAVLMIRCAFLICLLMASPAFAAEPIHRAPIVLKATSAHYLAGYPLDQYRLIKNEGGVAKIIPFQIDEQNQYTDYILTTSVSEKPLEQGDGVFNDNDELVYMGQDTGSNEFPKVWNFHQPEIIYRVDAAKRNMLSHRGSVFVAIYPDKEKRPPLSTVQYVDFDLQDASVKSSKYLYQFDPKNYMVVRGVSLITPDGTAKKIIHNSSFYLKSDFKYFLTFKVGHSDLKSTLEAYKVGPIRTIVKVSFSYVFLKLNFEIGMFTEVSFFENSIALPTIMHNPLEGRRTLNKGSGFYYGFAMPYDVKLLNRKSNMQPYSSKTKIFQKNPAVHSLYQLHVDNASFHLNTTIEPSHKMIQRGNVLEHYLEGGNPTEIMKRPWNKPLPLGKAPVNLGVYFDLSNFAQGVHQIGFQLFVGNDSSPEAQRSLRSIRDWSYIVIPSHVIAPKTSKSQ